MVDSQDRFNIITRFCYGAISAFGAPPCNRAYCPLTVSEAQREIRVYEESWDVPPR